MLERIQVVPGVSSAAVSTGIPVEGTSFGMLFDVVGPARGPGVGSHPAPASTWYAPAYFDTFGIPIVKGRAFTESDAAGRTPVAW